MLQISTEYKLVPVDPNHKSNLNPVTSTGKKTTGTNTDPDYSVIETQVVTNRLENPACCKFVSARSHMVSDGSFQFLIKEDENRKIRFKVVEPNKPEEFLSLCNKMKETLAGQCQGLELTGFPGGGSGIENIYQVKESSTDKSKFETVPADPKLFESLTTCLSSLLAPGTPLIITTSVGTGRGKSMQELANRLGKPVVATRGLVASDKGGLSAYSRKSWLIAEPNQK